MYNNRGMDMNGAKGLCLFRCYVTAPTTNRALGYDSIGSWGVGVVVKISGRCEKCDGMCDWSALERDVCDDVTRYVRARFARSRSRRCDICDDGTKAGTMELFRN